MGDLRELLDLLLRWVHVIAAIMWVGNSLLFNWLDRNLESHPSPRDTSQGRIWLLHSGGFYDVEKMISPGAAMPRTVHWFMWQAYTTWISGAVLLGVVYYHSGAALLKGGGVELSTTAAIAISVGVILGGRLVYDLVWGSPLGKRPRIAGALLIILLLALAYWLLEVFSGRAAYLHVGALLGTIMAGNVGHFIVPSQKAMVKGVEEGVGADKALSDKAKHHSIINNYLTFPVIVLMVSSHFPGFYASPNAWGILVVLLFGGARVRHILNERFGNSQWKPSLGVTIAGIVLLLFILMRTGNADPRGVPLSDPGVVTFEQVEEIVQQRCTVCHSASPADRTFGIAPGGVAFDLPEQIRAHAARIEHRAVITKTMPPANRTFLTDGERAVLGAWAREEANK